MKELPEKLPLGRFKITDELIREDFHSFLPFMAQICVIRCQHLYPYHFEYTALSDLFEEVGLGEEPPEYRIEVTVHDGEGKRNYSFKAVRI